MNGLKAWFLVCVVGLAGCTGLSPNSSIKQPMTARPEARPQVAYNDGAIYHAGQNQYPLFEDRRPRNVGDILTINLVEKTSANASTTNSNSRSNKLNASVPTITAGVAGAKLMMAPINVGGSNSNSGAASDANTTSNVFTGTITVTVIEVLSNGNLVVSGEKQVMVNQAHDFVRFSGVVNPQTIVNSSTTGINTVQSTQVADAHLEYKGTGYELDAASALSTLGRFFLSVLPF
jgi:flagellar L-ring protein precursor FlgH